MTSYLRQFEYVLLGVALALPLAVAVTVGLARWRIGRGRPVRQAWWHSAAEVAMGFGTAPWLVMALWPIDLPEGAVRWWLIPLIDVAAQLYVSPGYAFVQVTANLLVFFALGLGAPVRFPALARPARLFALGAGASLVLEVCQQVLGVGRVFSVDDILLNGLGCLLGGLLTRRRWAGRDRATPGRAASA